MANIIVLGCKRRGKKSDKHFSEHAGGDILRTCYLDTQTVRIWSSGILLYAEGASKTCTYAEQISASGGAVHPGNIYKVRWSLLSIISARNGCNFFWRPTEFCECGKKNVNVRLLEKLECYRLLYSSSSSYCVSYTLIQVQFTLRLQDKIKVYMIPSL